MVTLCLQGLCGVAVLELISFPGESTEILQASSELQFRFITLDKLIDIQT
jgi:hypothetical protein